MGLMADLTRQQLCAEVKISESTARRLELDGLPYTQVGKRGKRYDLAECKRWPRGHQYQSGSTRPVDDTRRRHGLRATTSPNPTVVGIGE